MGQAEIQKILEKETHRYISTLEMARTLNQTTSVITRALNTMLKYKEVFRIKIHGVYYWKMQEHKSIKSHMVVIPTRS